MESSKAQQLGPKPVSMQVRQMLGHDPVNMVAPEAYMQNRDYPEMCERARRAIETVSSDYWGNRMNIPIRYRGKFLSNFTVTEYESAVKGCSQSLSMWMDDDVEVNDKYVQGCRKAVAYIRENRNVTIIGPVGCGKTHLAVALLYEWLRTHLEFEVVDGIRFRVKESPLPYFIPSVEFFLLLKATYNAGSLETEMDVLKRLQERSLLLIDDVGAEKVTDWSRQMFYTLIDRRYRAGLPTIITSNMRLDAIAEQFDDRIASRLMHDGMALEIDDTDHRL